MTDQLNQIVELRSRERAILRHLEGTLDSSRRCMHAGAYFAFLRGVEEQLSALRQASVALVHSSANDEVPQ
jgi:hypothetical protein